MVSVHQKHMKFHSMDNHKPRMLKDFLNEKISNSSCSSSSNGLKSLPRKPITSTSMSNLIETDLNSNHNYSNPGIWCKTRLSESVIQTLLKVVKAVSFFTAVKKSQPAVTNGGGGGNKRLVKMKDIMRWKLCREPVAVVAEEERHSTAAASCSSSGWSCWSESDLSSRECDFEDAQNDVIADLQFSLFCFSPLGDGDGDGDGGDYVAAATGMEKLENKALIYQEQQHSPFSVLQVGENEFSPFDQRRKQTFMQHIQKIETLEEYDNDNDDDDDDDDDKREEEEDWVEIRARKMLHYVKSSSKGSIQSTKANLDKVLLDIFKEELNARRNQTSNYGNFDILKLAQDWIYKEHDDDDDNNNKDDYVKDMDLRSKWSKYEEELEELGLEIESTIYYGLINEIIMDLDC